jgi:Translationally controlled tumour protein
VLIDAAYMKKVKEAMKEKGKSEEDVTAFEKGAGAYAKKILGNFKDYDFYVGETMDPDGMLVLFRSFNNGFSNS